MLKKIKSLYYGIEHESENIITDQLFKEVVKDMANIAQNQFQTLDIRFNSLTDQQYELYAKNATVHRQANKINNSYFKQKKKTTSENNLQIALDKVEKGQKCPCCGLSTGNKISMWIQEDQLYFLGPGILLYYFFLKKIIYLTLITFILFGLPSMIINSTKKNHQYMQQQCNGYVYWCYFQIFFNSYNNQNKTFQLQTQSAIGLIWGICFIVIVQIFKIMGEQMQKKYDDNLFSPSDVTIKIQNLPRGDYTQNQLIETIIARANQRKLHIQIDNMIMVYDYHLIDSLYHKLKKNSLLLNELLKLPSLNDQQEKKFKYLKEQFFQSIKDIEDLRIDFVHKTDMRTNYLTNCAFIQFKTEQMTKNFRELFQTEESNIFSKIICWCKNFNQLKNKEIYLKNNLMSIERAPQPEDIIWDNCVYSRSRNMSIGIWLATIVINLASFSFIFGLLFLQKIFKKFNANINIYSEFVISIMIAMASVFINVLLRVCIEMTIDQQKHYTKSERAIALVNKIVIAQFLNAVIIPILSQYVIQRQTLHIQLSKMAFNYSIMNSFGLNLLLLFNYKFIVKYLLINTICIRNRIISYFSANQIHNDKKYIKGLNRFYEAEELDFSVSYAYCIGNLLHMSFFFFDQPVIIIFCLIGFMIYYSIQKFFLVTIYRTPDMISKVVFESMMDLLKYIPLAYAIGSFMSLRDIATLQSNLQSYVLHSLSIFVAVIGIFNPKNILNFIAHEVLFLLKNGKIQNSIKQHSENFFRYNKNYEEFNPIYKLLTYQDYLTKKQISIESKQMIYQFYSQFHFSNKKTIQQNNPESNRILR